MLGCAVAGLGIGEAHAKAYRDAPGCQLLWVYDLDPAGMRRAIETLGCGQAAANYEAMLGEEVQVVSIASYDDAHTSQVLAALERGKHVFVEKPLCCSTEELRAIRQTWEHAGRPHLGSNLVLRAAPLYCWLKEAIAAGDLGEIYAFDGDYLYGRLSKITEGWRKDVPDYSAMLGGGIHLVDLMLGLTGQHPATAICAGNCIASRGTPFRCNDFVAATYLFPSGLVGRITANLGCVHHHQHVVRVFGTQATFVSDDGGARLYKRRGSEAEAEGIGLAALPQTKGILVAGFVEAVQNGEDPSQAARREFDLLAVCLAADRALAKGAPAAISYD